MSKRIAMRAILALVVGVVLVLTFRPDSEPANPTDNVADNYPLSRTIKYSFVVSNPSSRRVEQARFWAYAPVQQTSHQYVTAINTSHPYRLETDNVGNQRLNFDVGAIPPLGSRLVDVRVELRLSTTAIATGEPGAEALAGQTFVELEAEPLQQIARSLRADRPLDTAQAIYDWVRSHVTNKGYVAKDRGALFAVTHQQGDCSEHMYATVALSRLNHIPAQGIAGYQMRESGVVHAAEQHNWARIWLDDAWAVVDTDRAEFAPDPTHYLAMRVLASDSSFHGDGSQQMFGGGDGLTVAMN